MGNGLLRGRSLREALGDGVPRLFVKRDDVIPFGFVLQPIGRLAGINIVGMRRRGASKDAVRAVQQAYALLFESEGEFAARIEQAEAKFGGIPEVAKIIAFIRARGHRPIMLSKVRGRRVEDND